jgi:hypothetical protein
MKCPKCDQFVLVNSKRHDRVCSFRSPDALPYYSENYNCNSEGEEKLTPSGVSMPVDKDSLVIKLIRTYKDLVEPMLLQSTSTFSCDPTVVSPSEKHHIQEESLVQFIQNRFRASGNTDGVYYIDVGAGKGRLSKLLGYELSLMHDESSVLICAERMSYKHKVEKSKYTRSLRAQVDICDLNVSSLLDAVDTIYPPFSSVSAGDASPRYAIFT